MLNGDYNAARRFLSPKSKYMLFKAFFGSAVIRKCTNNPLDIPLTISLLTERAAV